MTEENRPESLTSRHQRNRTIVAGHFQIPCAPQRLPFSLTGEDDSAFPIVRCKYRTAGHLLGIEGSFGIKFDAEFRNLYSPMNRIGGVSDGTRPRLTERLQRKITEAQVRRPALRVHVSPAGVGINGTVCTANVKEHELGVIGELEAQPIPARLIGLKLVSKELVVHPAGAAHFEALAAQLDRARGCKARKRNVVRRAARTVRLLADAIFTVNDRRLF